MNTVDRELACLSDVLRLLDATENAVAAIRTRVVANETPSAALIHARAADLNRALELWARAKLATAVQERAASKRSAA